jgi:hypothetical protein
MRLPRCARSGHDIGMLQRIHRNLPARFMRWAAKWVGFATKTGIESHATVS